MLLLRCLGGFVECHAARLVAAEVFMAQEPQGRQSTAAPRTTMRVFEAAEHQRDALAAGRGCLEGANTQARQPSHCPQKPVPRRTQRFSFEARSVATSAHCQLVPRGWGRCW